MSGNEAHTPIREIKNCENFIKPTFACFREIKSPRNIRRIRYSGFLYLDKPWHSRYNFWTVNFSSLATGKLSDNISLENVTAIYRGPCLLSECGAGLHFQFGDNQKPYPNPTETYPTYINKKEVEQSQVQSRTIDKILHAP